MAQTRDEMSAPSADEIRQGLAAERESISETVDKLGERLREAVDWRQYVTDHPLLAVGMAAGAGLWLSGLFRRRPSPRERIADAIADNIEDLADSLRERLLAWVPDRKSGPAVTMKAAATTLASRAAINFVRRKVSGSGQRSATGNGDVDGRAGHTSRRYQPA